MSRFPPSTPVNPTSSSAGLLADRMLGDVGRAEEKLDIVRKLYEQEFAKTAMKPARCDHNDLRAFQILIGLTLAVSKEECKSRLG